MLAQVKVLAQHVVIEGAVANMAYAQFQQARFQDALVIGVGGVVVTQVRIDADKVHKDIGGPGGLNVSGRCGTAQEGSQG